jgi:CMP-N-acetylneuraminic acid synthetase
MKHIAVIPARAGSKSIPNKNLIRIGNKRLIDYSIEMALKQPFFDRVLVTTDIEDLLDTDYPEKVSAHKREDALCDDDSLMLDVMRDIIITRNISPKDYVWLLQPTTPFRRDEDFQAIYEKVEHVQPQSLISVVDVNAYHPNRMYTIKLDHLYPLRFTNFENKQELMPAYIRNGAFYVFKVQSFMERGSFYIKPCTAYGMPEINSINIDGPLEAFLANALVEAGKV